MLKSSAATPTGASFSTPSMSLIITSLRPWIISLSCRAPGVSVSASAMPNSSEKRMRAIMSPSAAALMGLVGTMAAMSAATEVSLGAGAAFTAVPFIASARASSLRPAPGWKTLTITSPMSTAMLETTTV